MKRIAIKPFIRTNCRMVLKGALWYLVIFTLNGYYWDRHLHFTGSLFEWLSSPTSMRDNVPIFILEFMLGGLLTFSAIYLTRSAGLISNRYRRFLIVLISVFLFIFWCRLIWMDSYSDETLIDMTYSAIHNLIGSISFIAVFITTLIAVIQALVVFIMADDVIDISNNNSGYDQSYKA